MVNKSMGLAERAVQIAARRGYSLTWEEHDVWVEKDGVRVRYEKLGAAMVAIMTGRVRVHDNL